MPETSKMDPSTFIAHLSRLTECRNDICEMDGRSNRSLSRTASSGWHSLQSPPTHALRSRKGSAPRHVVLYM